MVGAVASPADGVSLFQTPVDDYKVAQGPFIHRVEDVDIDVSQEGARRVVLDVYLTDVCVCVG